MLVSSKRVVERFGDLTKAEVADIWELAQEVGTKVERHFGADSLTLCIQDGPSAGQTVKHVHIHCLPRKAGDFENNDEVYDKLEEASVDRQRSLIYVQSMCVDVVQVTAGS